MVMRRTDNYDSDIGAAMEKAVKDFIVNDDYYDNLNLTVKEDSVSVGGKSCNTRLPSFLILSSSPFNTHHHHHYLHQPHPYSLPL